jgi:hypothetical protein
MSSLNDCYWGFDQYWGWDAPDRPVQDQGGVQQYCVSAPRVGVQTQTILTNLDKMYTNRKKEIDKALPRAPPHKTAQQKCAALGALYEARAEPARTVWLQGRCQVITRPETVPSVCMQRDCTQAHPYPLGEFAPGNTPCDDMTPACSDVDWYKPHVSTAQTPPMPPQL